MNLELISSLIETYTIQNDPLGFFKIISDKYQDGRILENEVNCFLERYYLHSQNINNKKISMYLAMQDTYNVIIYRGTKIEKEPSKNIIQLN